MTRTSRIAVSAAVTLISALSAVQSAHASAAGSATIGDLSFRLIDLDLNDGLGSFYTLSQTTGAQSGMYLSVDVTLDDTVPGLSESVSETRDGLFYGLSATVGSSGNALATGVVTASSVTVSGLATQPGALFDAIAGTGMSYGNLDDYLIELAPHSVLVVTARADASVLVDSVDDESAFASASLSLNYEYELPGGGFTTYGFEDRAEAYANAGGVPGSSGKWLTAVFTNSSDVAQRASLLLVAQTRGSVSATAIPEVGTSAMFGLGLLGLFGVARRRGRCTLQTTH